MRNDTRTWRCGVMLLLLTAAGIVTAGCTGPYVRHNPRLVERLDALLDRQASTGAVIHARVVELPGRRELYARNSDLPCTPASNLKLVVSAAGLDLFGPDHTFKTYLAHDGGDLWIIGTGDPATGDPRLARRRDETPVTMLQEWAAALKQRGVERIAGDLVCYDGVFEAQQVHPSWKDSFLLHWYAAPVAGLSFNDNCVDITVFPTEEGKPVRYEVMPPVQDIEVINECVTRDEGRPSIVKRRGGNIYRIGGGCHEETELKSKPVEDPGAFFADALRTQLVAAGISVDGRIRRSTTPLGDTIPPPAGSIVAVHESKISDVLSRINKNSQNLFAECLCKLTGREWETRRGRDVPGSWANGSAAIHAFVRSCGIDDTPLVVDDGSGLSFKNRVSARLLTDLLAVMFSRPDGEAYRASLAVAGVDGSLHDRMSDFEGHVFGKTGYIGGVSSLSGYVRTRDDTWLAFSFMYNDIPQDDDDDRDTEPFTTLQDEACRILVDWPDIPAEPAASRHVARASSP